MNKIAIIVPVCSRNQTYKSIKDTPIVKYLYPSVKKTKNNMYEYTFFIGYDDDDIFYKNNISYIEQIGQNIKTFELHGCAHAPAYAWNQLFVIAYNENYDYFLQIGDDAVIHTDNWTDSFINKLKETDYIGVVGPSDPVNYLERKKLGIAIILEVTFVSRKHYEIFNTYFHPDIKNWFCDNWISAVYQINNNKYFYIFEDINYTNEIRDGRYLIHKCPQIYYYIIDGQKKLVDYIGLKNTNTSDSSSS
jgi:hypothetical protein